ncbi:hypothetical protein ACWDE9_43440 [Streptomyces olivaceoviridis]
MGAGLGGAGITVNVRRQPHGLTARYQGKRYRAAWRALPGVAEAALRAVGRGSHRTGGERAVPLAV